MILDGVSLLFTELHRSALDRRKNFFRTELRIPPFTPAVTKQDPVKFSFFCLKILTRPHSMSSEN